MLNLSVKTADTTVMGTVRTPKRRITLRSESGLTLVEMMITVMILVVVLLATFSLLDTTREAASRDEERGQSIREVQSGLLRMAKEARHAYRITAAGPNSITFLMRCAGGETCNSTGTTARSKLVRYTCSTQCVREASTSASSGPCCDAPTTSEVVIARVQNGSVAAACPPATGSSPAPVFSYKVRDPAVGSERVQDACDSNGVARTAATDIAITISVPAAGEKPNQGYRRSVVLRDAVYLRNRDLR